MAAGVKITAAIPDERETLRKFRALQKRGARRAMNKAVRAGSAPQVKESKRTAPRESGLLKKRITQKVKSYRRGQMVLAVIGARSVKDPATGRNPAKYVHLVNEGHKARKIVPRQGKKRMKFFGPGGGRKRNKTTGRYENTGLLVRAAVNHPGFAGTQFMQKSYRAKKAESLSRFNSKFYVEVVAEAKKG